ALLRRFVHLDRVIGREIGAIRFGDRKSRGAVTRETVETARQLTLITPPSRQVRGGGQLDMMGHSTRSFGGRLGYGQESRGVLPSVEQMEELAGLFGTRVVVMGRAVYRPSGSLLRIDAAAVEEGAAQSGLFSKIPEPIQRHRSYVTRVRAYAGGGKN